MQSNLEDIKIVWKAKPWCGSTNDLFLHTPWWRPTEPPGDISLIIYHYCVWKDAGRQASPVQFSDKRKTLLYTGTSQPVTVTLNSFQLHQLYCLSCFHDGCENLQFIFILNIVNILHLDLLSWLQLHGVWQLLFFGSNVHVCILHWKLVTLKLTLQQKYWQ